MWKGTSFRKSSYKSVHASKPYSKMNDNMQVWYKRSFFCNWNLVCRQTLFIEGMAEATPIRLRISGW